MEGQDQSPLNLFHFFDLPREVRDLVYNDLLELEPLSRNQLHTDNFVGYLDAPSQLCRQISRQFRTEVEDLIKRMGRLRLEEVVPRTRFDEQETRAALKQVRHVEIYMFPCEWATLNGWDAEEDPPDDEAEVRPMWLPSLYIHSSARDFVDVLRTLPLLVSVRIKLYMHEQPASPLWASLGASRNDQWPDKETESETYEHLEKARNQLQKLVKIRKLRRLEVFHASEGLWRLRCTSEHCREWEYFRCTRGHCMSWKRTLGWKELQTQPDSAHEICVTWGSSLGWKKPTP